MKILIEGEKYNLRILEEIFDDSKFYQQENNEGRILFVGYYRSTIRREIIYMLPKVFMIDSNYTVFGVKKEDLVNTNQSPSFIHEEKYNWIRKILVHFYNSLIEFKRRNKDSKIAQLSLLSNFNSKNGIIEYSYLDLLLSFVNFYKKNNNFIIIKKNEIKSKQFKNIKWERTVVKSNPDFTASFQPVYKNLRITKKTSNAEEELLIYYLSIINNFNEEHNLGIKINDKYSIFKGNDFRKLQKTGLLKLKRIKYRYFNDTMKSIYNLCELYFSSSITGSSNNKREEYVFVNNYNLVFEDMIDKLFSDSKNENKRIDGLSLKNLKYNDDGKIIDHVFDYQSIFDTSDIFYIGDSKYYKSENLAGGLSYYKQFTYAKNVIQYNINLLNETGEKKIGNLRYRDNVTEGYNITPNFFIYGYIDRYTDFDNDNLEVKGDIVKSCHFQDRLFDRDTLFIHQYKINFLFVLKSYTASRFDIIESFRLNTKKVFRKNFIDFFSNDLTSEYKFYKYNGKEEIDTFVEKHFKLLNGKCYKTIDDILILACHKGNNKLDVSFNNIIKFFIPFEFSI
jgi:hypothetical protein